MSDARGKDSSFLRKVVKFVSNPNTEWGELDAPAPAESPGAQDRSELQVMIERKRRNDFVRRQELDLLRQIRREGLTGEQIRAIEREQGVQASGFEPTEQGVLGPSEVRRRIDGIEREMAYEDTEVNTRSLGLNAAESSEDDLNVAAPRERSTGTLRATTPVDWSAHITRPAPGRRLGAEVTMPRVDLQFDTTSSAAHLKPPPGPGGAPAASAPQSPAAPAVSAPWHPMLSLDGTPPGVQHDPELDQAVIAFANADFSGCEKFLRSLVERGGARERHVPTWQALLDLYRAMGQQQRFDWTAATYVKDLGQSAPSWVSIPRLAMNMPGQEAPVAAGATERSTTPQGTPGSHPAGERGQTSATWSCPAFLDATALTALSSFVKSQAAEISVIDWSGLQMLDGAGASALRLLLRDWAATPTPMRWTGVDALFKLLEIAAPPGDHMADLAFWQVRLGALRMLGDQGAYELASEDYAATYGAQAPEWQTAARSVMQPPGEAVGMLAPSRDFAVSTLPDELGSTATVQVELVGQLAGDVNATLVQALGEIGDASTVVMSCARLIRVDLMAAGELLNWVAERRAEGRLVRFVDVHRMVALFFCAMGLDDQANIQLRPL